MKKLKIVKLPNPVLHEVSKPVDSVDNRVRKLMVDMLDLMYESKGIGLAAVQVGVLERVIVVDVWQDGKNEPLMMANPEIVFVSEDCADMEEGCLSVPSKTINISRPRQVSVKYVDFYNKSQILHADELLATCLQHEIDHLNGITIVDKQVS